MLLLEEAWGRHKQDLAGKWKSGNNGEKNQGPKVSEPPKDLLLLLLLEYSWGFPGGINDKELALPM